MNASPTTITVLYERKFSDGSYGSEGLSLAWTGTIHEDEPLVISAKYSQIASSLRRQVLAELSASAAERVAWAAKRELEKPAQDRLAQIVDERAEAWARSNANAEERALKSQPDEELEDIPF